MKCRDDRCWLVLAVLLVSCSERVTSRPGTGGECGVANDVATTAPPVDGLCVAGEASEVAGTGPWSWRCVGVGSGATVSCSAPIASGAVDGECGPADGVNTLAAPSSGLCAVGTPSAIGGTGPWGWTCAGIDGGATATCEAPLASPLVGGECGPADGVATDTAPASSHLCATGTPSAVTGTGPWTWTCAGINGAAAASCEAPISTPTPVDGECGTADGVATDSAPSSGLCSAGTPSALSGTGPWAWTCVGTNGGATASCEAPISTPTPVDGECGTANGVATSSAPTNDLCAAGTPSAISGTGPWAWTCTGTNGGSDGACSAPVSQQGGGPTAPGPSAKLFADQPYYTCVANRYVATPANGGSNSNDGQAATAGGGHGPWATIQHALDSIPDPAPGWCINVGDGEYPVNSEIQVSKGGDKASKTGFLVIRAMSLLGARLKTGSAWSTINIQAPYVIVEGFEIAGNRTGKGINTCSNCCDYNGIHHVIALNNYIYNHGESGVSLCWAEYYWVIHNRLDKNGYNTWDSGVSIYEPMEVPGYTPTTYDAQWTPYHNVIAHNSCHANFTNPAGNPHTDGNGIIYDDTQHTQNPPHTVYDPMALIIGNVSWENGGAGIQIGPTSANAHIFNNTAYRNYRDTVNDGTWRGNISASLSHNLTFKNNIGIAEPGAGILSNNSPFISGNPVSNNTWSHNIAYGADVVMYAPDTFPTPDNKLNTDPQLVDHPNGNFALQSGSPAIGFGDQVPFWQQQTPGQIDVGACPSGLTQCP